MFKKFIDYIGKYGLRQKQLQAELERLQKQNSRLVREKEWLAKMVWQGAGFDLRFAAVITAMSADMNTSAGNAG